MKPVAPLAALRLCDSSLAKTASRGVKFQEMTLIAIGHGFVSIRDGTNVWLDAAMLDRAKGNAMKRNLAAQA